MSYLEEAIIVLGFCALFLSNINLLLFLLTTIIYIGIGTVTFVTPITHTTKIIVIIVELVIIIISLMSGAWQITHFRQIKNHENNIRTTLLNAFIMKEMDKIHQRKLK